MKKLLSILSLVVLGLPFSANAAAFQVVQGGTGATSFTTGKCVIGNGTSALTSGNCGVGNVSTSTAETATYIPVWSSTNGTPALLKGGTSAFTFNTTGNILTVTNASTTNFTASYASSTSLVGGTITIPNLGTSAGTFLAVNPSGVVIATTTPSTSVSGGTTGMLTSWASASTLTATGTPTATAYFATSTTATSSLLGNLYVGTTTNGIYPTQPASFIIDQGSKSSQEVFDMFTNNNNFVEDNLQNISSGANAQGCRTATQNGGNLRTAFISMCTNSTGFWNPQTYNVGGESDFSIQSLGGDLYFNQGTAGKTMWLLNGGVSTTTANQIVLKANSSTGLISMATSTPAWGLLTIATSTLPQLSLSDGVAADNPWTLRSISNSFYLATSTATATSTTAAFSINANGQMTNPFVKSALRLADANGGIGAYAGATCTNQFVRSLNGAGAATCNTVSLTTDVTGTLPLLNGGTGLTATGASSTVLTTNGTTNSWQKLDLGAGVYGTLPIANGGTNATAFTTSGNSVYWNGTSLVTAPTTAVVLTPNASTTNFSAGSSNLFNVYANGEVSGFDKNTAVSGQISPTHYLSTKIATSTSPWTATSSVSSVYGDTAQIVMPFSGTFRTLSCATSAGTLEVSATVNSTSNYYPASTTPGIYTFSSTFTQGQILTIVGGNPASSPLYTTCTLGVTQTI